MLLQIGQIFGQVLREVIPAGVDIGRQFLARELSRDQRRAEKDLIKRLQASQGLSTGSAFNVEQSGVFSPTFNPTIPAVTPATIDLRGLAERGIGAPPGSISMRRVMPTTGVNGTGPALPETLGMRPPRPSLTGANRFVLDRATGCLRMVMAGEKATHKLDNMGDFVRIKPRRMNPLNISAARRASRRIDRTLDAVKSLVTISEKRDKGVRARGKVVKFRTRPKRKRC